MINFFYTIAVYLAGFLSSYVNWTEFFGKLFDVASMKYKKLLTLAVFMFLSFLFFIFIYTPLWYIVDNEEKENPSDGAATKISARQEIRRRSSWPVAYSSFVLARYEQ